MKKIGTRSIIINEKRCKDLVIYFIRHILSKSIKMFSLHYHEEEIKEPGEKNTGG